VSISFAGVLRIWTSRRGWSMKKEIPQVVLDKFYAEARAGYGREVEIDGGNTRVTMTLFSGDFPDAEKFKEIHITVNQKGEPIGYKLIPKGVR
jgi:hypothetical protein